MVLLPLYDIDPLEGKTKPWVTYGLIAANIVVAIVAFGLPAETYNSLLNIIGLVPASETRELPRISLFPRDLALFTSMFLHADWEHLLFNMLFLWIFGDNIEDAIGHLRFFIFYILCGLAAGATYVVSAPHDTMPLIGASGAIAGVLAAYLMIRPCAKIEVLVFVVPLRAPAYLAIGSVAKSTKSPRSPNRLLASLRSTDFEVLRPHLKHVELVHEVVLYKTSDTIDRVYFPHSGIISLAWISTAGN